MKRDVWRYGECGEMSKKGVGEGRCVGVLGRSGDECWGVWGGEGR